MFQRNTWNHSHCFCITCSFQKKNDSRTNSTVSPLKTAPYIFEGDIILQPKQALEVVELGKRRQKRKLHANTVLLWKLPIWYTYHPDEYSKSSQVYYVHAHIIELKIEKYIIKFEVNMFKFSMLDIYCFWFSYLDKLEEDSILKSITTLEKLTCIRFKKIDYHLLLNKTYQLENPNNVTVNFTKDMGWVQMQIKFSKKHSYMYNFKEWNLRIEMGRLII